MPKTIKLTLSDDILERASRYIIDGRPAVYYVEDAFLEWLNRKEGRDKRAREELLLKNADSLQEVLDSGHVWVPGEIVK